MTQDQQSVLKTQTIKLLRTIIERLEDVVEKLETEPIKEIPPETAFPATAREFPPVSETTTAPIRTSIGKHCIRIYHG